MLCVWEGMNDILSKPFTKTGLFEMLEVNVFFFSKNREAKVANVESLVVFLYI